MDTLDRHCQMTPPADRRFASGVLGPLGASFSLLFYCLIVPFHTPKRTAVYDSPARRVLPIYGYSSSPDDVVPPYREGNKVGFPFWSRLRK